MATALDYSYISSSERGAGNSPYSLSPQEAYLLFLLIGNLIEYKNVSFINVTDYDELDAFLANLLNKLISSDATEEFMIGEIKYLSYDGEPDGWMKCDGRMLLIADFPELYEVIGTTWGAYGVTGFYLPDARQRSPVGEGALVGNTELNGTFPIGFQSSDFNTTLQVANLPPHHHATAAASTGTGNIYTAASPYQGNSTPATGWNTFDTGDALPFSRLPPVFTVNIIIRVMP